LKFFGIGGSKLDSVIEQFLIEAKFPYAIGYGLTETSPLLAGVNPQMVRHQSTGPAVQGVQLKLDHVNPETGEGEILAKGPNVMKGYYKDPKSTSEVFTLDGWFKTGDLASIDKDGFVFIKGRLKNVIIGPGGENIYPEEIEALINNFQFVAESLVIEQKGKLVAFVHFNMEELEKKYQNLKGDVKQYIESKQMELSDEFIFIN
jgi:long-chain acyl-CoA synthetase